ncbi:hypothetical protein M5K25_017829 [Dendrobium thyrsiflorum]|uniref:Uncharacterized protein n=1 Tax=Dendrobium thyrsiflorum TaxID=117978 RepID=A0ABD0UGM7_DENTH
MLSPRADNMQARKSPGYVVGGFSCLGSTRSINRKLTVGKRKRIMINDKGKKFTLVEDPKQGATERCQVLNFKLDEFEIKTCLNHVNPKYAREFGMGKGLGPAAGLGGWQLGKEVVEVAVERKGGSGGSKGERRKGGRLGWFSLEVSPTAAREEGREEEAWPTGGGRERKGKIGKNQERPKATVGYFAWPLLGSPKLSQALKHKRTSARIFFNHSLTINENNRAKYSLIQMTQNKKTTMPSWAYIRPPLSKG